LFAPGNARIKVTHFALLCEAKQKILSLRTTFRWAAAKTAAAKELQPHLRASSFTESEEKLQPELYLSARIGSCYLSECPA
jgi:hypothetical protein